MVLLLHNLMLLLWFLLIFVFTQNEFYLVNFIRGSQYSSLHQTNFLQYICYTGWAKCRVTINNNNNGYFLSAISPESS